MRASSVVRPPRNAELCWMGGAPASREGRGPAAEVNPRLRGGAAPAAEATVEAAPPPNPPLPPPPPLPTTPQSATTTSMEVAPPRDPTLSMAFTTSYPSITCSPQAHVG